MRTGADMGVSGPSGELRFTQSSRWVRSTNVVRFTFADARGLSVISSVGQGATLKLGSAPAFTLLASPLNKAGSSLESSMNSLRVDS